VKHQLKIRNLLPAYKTKIMTHLARFNSLDTTMSIHDLYDELIKLRDDKEDLLPPDTEPRVALNKVIERLAKHDII